MKKNLTLCIGLTLLWSCSQKPQTSEIEQKIDSLINIMTIEEKVALIHAESSFTSGGVARLGIPHWVMSDGPHGVRKEHGTDYTPDKGVFDSLLRLQLDMKCLADRRDRFG